MGLRVRLKENVVFTSMKQQVLMAWAWAWTGRFLVTMDIHFEMSMCQPLNYHILDSIVIITVGITGDEETEKSQSPFPKDSR